MKPKAPLVLRRTTPLFLALATLCQSAHAANQTYDDANGSNVWDLATTNWDTPTVAWTNGNNAIFGGTGESVAVNAAVTAGDITFNSTGYTIANGTGALTLANATNTFTVTNGSDSATIAESIAGTGLTITKAGAGSLTLSAANTYTGGTAVNAGTLVLGNAAGFGTGTVSIGASGMVTANIAGNIANAFTGSGILSFTAPNNTENSLTNATALNSFTGTLNITGSGSGKLSLKTVAGQTIGSGATVNIAAAGTLYIGTNATFSGVTFNLNGNGNSENNGALRLEGGAIIDASSSVILLANSQIGAVTSTGTINAVISGSSFSLTKRGSGTTILGATNSYGATTITTGILQVGNGGTTGTLGTGAITNNAQLNFNRTDTYTLPNAVTGTGAIFVNSGTLELGANNVTSGTTGSFFQTTGSGTVNATGAGRIVLNSAGADIGVKSGSGTLTINAIIQETGGARGVDFYGDSATGTTVLTAANTFTGAVTLQQGTVSVSSINDGGVAGNLGTNGTINLGSFATVLANAPVLKYTGTGETNNRGFALTSNAANQINVIEQAGTGLLKFSGNVTSAVTGAKTLQLQGSTAGTGELSGIISNATGTTAITKAGTGTWTLSGANTYSGTTSVNAGKLVVTDSLANSAVTVSNAGTILASDAAATLGSSLTINSGAILAAGDAGAAGTATVGGASTFNNGSIFSWDINSTGTSYDKLIATGLAGQTEAGDAVFRIVAADSTFGNAFWSSTRTWTDIFTTNGSTAISNWANLFSVAVVNSTFAPLSPTNGSFSISGNTLTWSAVPEPTTALAGILLGAGLLRRRRSRESGVQG